MLPATSAALAFYDRIVDRRTDSFEKLVERGVGDWETAAALAAGLRGGLRRGHRDGIFDLVVNFFPGLAAGLLFGWGTTAAVLLGGITYISSSGVIAKLISDLGFTGNRETGTVLTLLVVEDLEAGVTFVPGRRRDHHRAKPQVRCRLAVEMVERRRDHE